MNWILPLAYDQIELCRRLAALLLGNSIAYTGNPQPIFRPLGYICLLLAAAQIQRVKAHINCLPEVTGFCYALHRILLLGMYEKWKWKTLNKPILFIHLQEVQELK